MNDPLPQRYAGRASVNTIREVFDYIRRYRGKTFVLKLDDGLIGHPLFPLLMKDIVQLHDIGISLILVMGTRTAIEKHLAKAGLHTKMVNGIRITPRAAMDHIKLAAMEVVQTIISHLSAGQANGIMGNWIRARSLGVCRGVDFEYTGHVEKIQSDIIHKLMGQDFIPILYNIGMNALGDGYNLNSDQIARQVCMDLSVEKLFFIRAQDAIPGAGLLLPPGSQVHPDGEIVSNMDIDQVGFMLDRNKKSLNPENQTLLGYAKEVIDRPGGVKRVHIIDGRKEGRLLQEVFSSIGGGTLIYGNQYAHIRRATLEDIPEILRLLDGYVQKGNLIMRTALDIRHRIHAYHIYAVDHAVYGCGALYEYGNGWGEIGAVAVNEDYKSKGIGRGLVQFLIQKAREKKIKTLFLLTTQAADWFFEFGFVWADPADLPESHRQRYNLERNSRVLFLTLQGISNN
ncbi:amino-acid N-acetyltransferase [Desulfospira joergensenii]|uniref:amino-acid N-acetyltransferase n=1 Tax=Desulfospira joergensenii TaxID=53329 RepID=UPI001378E488|nr:amino-acid N-acetyltransferase [Desulfospira joergensenii]